MQPKERRKLVTKYSYSEVQPAYTSSQSARLSSLSSFNTVEATLEQFASSTSLSGPGWDSAKQALAPYSVIAKALYNYQCDFGETFASFLASFESEVGETSKTLDTEELADLQAKINRLQQEKQDLLLKIAGNIALEIIGGYGVMYKEFQIDQKQKKVDLLQKYEVFETNHANDFSEIKAIGTQLKTALSDLGKAKQFNAKTGKYSKLEYTNYEWYQKLSDYNDSCPTQRMEIVAEYQEAAGHGLTVYKVYIDGKYNKEASTNLQWLMLQDSLKMVVDIGGELTGISDLYRLFFGKDPLTGGAASRLEAGLWTALLLLPTGKIVEGIKEIKAGNRLLKGMDLTADELKILNKAGYFDDVAKIEKVSGLDYLDNQLGSMKNNVKVNKYESAESVNNWWKKQGYSQPPYTPKTVVQEITLLEDTKFVRVYDGVESGLYGGWIMRAEDVKGLTPLQIQEKFALPRLPEYIGEVVLPKGSTIRAGEVNPLFGNKGGGFQFDMMQQRIGEFKEIGKIIDWSGK
jgi:hypothetical protein